MQNNESLNEQVQLSSTYTKTDISNEVETFVKKSAIRGNSRPQTETDPFVVLLLRTDTDLIPGSRNSGIRVTARLQDLSVASLMRGDSFVIDQTDMAKVVRLPRRVPRTQTYLPRPRLSVCG